MNIVYSIILQWQKDNKEFIEEGKRLRKISKKQFILHSLKPIKKEKKNNEQQTGYIKTTCRYKT